MNILFVCRGNAFRSIIAEALLKSKEIPGVEVHSAGTVAAEYYEFNKPHNASIKKLLASQGLANYTKETFGTQLTQETIDEADKVVLMNDIVLSEINAQHIVLPQDTEVWDITDVGEKDRIAANQQERDAFVEVAFEEIKTKVDGLVCDVGVSTGASKAIIGLRDEHN